MAGPLSVAIISPEHVVYEGRAEMVVAPAWDGEVGVLKGHAPLLALLGTGALRVREAGEELHFHVSGGFLQVVEDRVTVLSESAEAGSPANGG